VIFNDRVYCAPDILAAWHCRSDLVTKDGLWRAACWVQAGLQRTTNDGRKDAFENAADIICADPVAWFEMWMVLTSLARARRPQAADRADWGRAKARAWR
jgi:hypothetical protein